ncbi:LytR/AlgR family response regulator transcription factor [Olivibacter jilunii]|uniref:LytR/AlgR family response regulator transcription factor n=1 Tax=Olivibacter jilunii TaxID=985016 RepID=UPI003F153D87
MVRCVLIEDEPLARKGIEDHLKQIPFINLLASYENAMEALSFLMANEVDLVLSDINMPGINGIEFLKSLAKPPLFVFITGRGDYAAESYELEGFDFILKPYSFERLLKSMTRVATALSKKEVLARTRITSGKFAIKDKYRNHLVPYKQILYFEGEKEYVRIVTTEKDYVIIGSLKKIAEELTQDIFIRVHKSYIINRDYVRAIDPDKILMRGSIKDIPLGVTYRDEVYRELLNNK